MSTPKLDIDRTRTKLNTLGLTYAAGYLDYLLAEAVAKEIAPHAFLDRLLGERMLWT